MDDAPLIWAREAVGGGWCWLRSRVPAPRALPPPTRALVRGLARREPGSELWWRGWMDALAPSLAPILAGRGTRLLLVPSVAAAERGVRIPWKLRPVQAAAGGWIEPTPPAVLPLRPWPPPDDAAVRRAAWQVAEGITAPIVVRWLPRLAALLLLDGHARLLAASTADRPLPALVALPIERGAEAVVERDLARLRGGVRSFREEVAAVGGPLAEVLRAPEAPTPPRTWSYR
jgi:hypothetical protein